MISNYKLYIDFFNEYDNLKRINIKSMDHDIAQSDIAPLAQKCNLKIRYITNLKQQLSTIEHLLSQNIYIQLNKSIDDYLEILNIVGDDITNVNQMSINKISVLHDTLLTQEYYEQLLINNINNLSSMYYRHLVNEYKLGNITSQELHLFYDQISNESSLKNIVKLSLVDVESLEQKKINNIFFNQLDIIENITIPNDMKKSNSKNKIQDKIDYVEASIDNPYYYQFLEESFNKELDRLNKDIQKLENMVNKKASDVLRLSRLKEARKGMANYYLNGKLDKADFIANLRENWIAKNRNQINITKHKLQTKRELSQNYDSKLSHFVSNKQIAKLENRLEILRQKEGTIMSSQKIAALNHYDSISQSINNKANIVGTITGINYIAHNKLEKLKNLKRQVLKEVSNVKNDVSRFQSIKKDRVTSLKGKNGVIDDTLLKLETNKTMVA